MRKKIAKSAFLVTFLMILISVMMIIFGIKSGGNNDVFTKAVNICLECIGIG